MSRTAASAKMAGVDMDKLLGYLAVTGEVTQKSMSQIGESFKTIFARFGNIKAGKFVDDETGESLNDVAKVLSKFNIQLYDAQGNMKNVGDILDTLGNKWDGLTEVEQNALATAIAGTRQRENFIVLMENYSRATELATKSMDSAGIAEEKFGAYTEGVEAKMNKLRATFEEFSQDLLNSDLIGMFLDLGQGILKSFNSPMTQAILKAAAFFIVLKTGQKTISLFKKKIGSSNEVLWDYIIALLAGKTHTEALAFASEGLSKALTKTNLIMAGATLVISAAIMAYQHYKQKLDETIEAWETAKDEVESLNSELQTNENRIKELLSMDSLSYVEEEELKKLREANVLLKENLELAKQQEKDAASEALDELERTRIHYSGNLLNKETDNAKELADAWYNANARMNAMSPVQAFLPKELKDNAYRTTEITYYFKQYQALQEELENLTLGTEEYTEISKRMTDLRTGVLNEELNSWKTYRDTINSMSDEDLMVRYEDGWQEVKKQANDYYQQMMLILNPEGYKAIRWEEVLGSEEFEGAKEKLQEWIDEGLTQEEVLKKLNQVFPSLIDKLKEFGIEEDDIINQFKKAEQGVESYVQALEDIKKNIEETKNAYDSITSALDEYNNSGSISYDTYMSLLDLGSEYVELLFDENGALVNNGNTIQSLMQIKLQQYAIEKALAYLNYVAANGVNSLSKSLEEEANATNVLTQAQITQAQIALLQIKDENERRIAAEKFVAMVNSVNKVSLGNTSATNSNSKAKEKAKEIQDQYNSALEYAKTVLDEEIEKLEEEKEVIEERNEALQEELDIYDKALAYINKYISGKIDALEKEKQALQEKNDEQEREIELEELRNNINKNHQRTMRTYSEDQGWTWVVDPEDIKETEDAIKEYNKKVAEYEKEDEIAKIEEQIEAWEEYLAKWEEIPDVYEEMEAKIAFESLSAYVTEKDLLNKRTNAIDKFKKSYVKKQKEISKNTTEEVDKQIEKLQDIKEKWDSIPSDYETASNKLNAEMLLGKDAREKILSGETGVIQNFASAYAIAMENAEKAAKQGASGISSALSNISLPEITINDILGKGVGVEEVDMTIGKNAKIKGDTLYNPFTKRYYYLNDMQKNEDGTYTAKAGTFYFTTAYASGTLSAKAGIANVDEKGNELIVPKQGRYRMMEYGDTVVPHNLSQRLFDVATNPLKFIANAINSIKSPILNEFGGNNNTTTISIGNITMPQSINNADKFVRELQIIAANR